MISIGYKRFVYHKPSKAFTIDASELSSCGWSPGTAIEVNGKEASVQYVQSKIVRDRDGDVQVWEYSPVYEEVKRVPGARNTKVVVFND